MSANVRQWVTRRFMKPMLDHGRPLLIDAGPKVFVCGVSRSGTTLLAAIFDAHSEITMGYELVPPPIGNGLRPGGYLEEALAAPDLKSGVAMLSDRGDAELGKWLRRCHRVGATPKDLRAAFSALDQRGADGAQSVEQRLALAAAVIGRVQERAGAALSGFKLTGQFEQARALFPQGRFVYILRDPRDVFASQVARGYGRSARTVANSWMTALSSFETLQINAPTLTTLIRYEDLVRGPEDVIRRAFSILPLDFEDSVLRPELSDATILRTGHPSAEQVTRGLYPDSIGRGTRDLPAGQRRAIEQRCAESMERHGYVPARRGIGALTKLSKREIATK